MKDNSFSVHKDSNFDNVCVVYYYTLLLDDDQSTAPIHDLIIHLFKNVQLRKKLIFKFWSSMYDFTWKLYVVTIADVRAKLETFLIK